MTFNSNDPQTTIKSEFDGHFMSGDNRNIDTADIIIQKKICSNDPGMTFLNPCS